MDQITHDVRRANWLNIIQQCQNRPSGMTAKQWMAENDVKDKAYYYWLRKFRKEAHEQMQLPMAAAKSEIAFAEVSLPIPTAETEQMPMENSKHIPAAVIKCNGVTIEISNTISDKLLGHLLREVSHA